MIFFSLEGRLNSGVAGKFKCPLKKTQPFCPRSTALNWTGKGLMSVDKVKSVIKKCVTFNDNLNSVKIDI